MRRAPYLLPATLSLSVTTTALLVIACAGGGGGSGGGGAAPVCAPGSYFEYEDGLCGGQSDAGACRMADAGECSESTACGCDGIIHGSGCAAHAAGVDTTGAHLCAPPAGFFDCGEEYCSTATELCYSFHGYTEPHVCDHTVYCQPIPEECLASPTCECIAQAPEYDGFAGGCWGDPVEGLRWSDGDCG